MSEENLQKREETNVTGPENQGVESFQIKVNKSTNEITFINPITGSAATIKATITEEGEDEADEPTEQGKREPLTPDEFQFVLRKLDELGVAWTTDVPPFPIFKEGFRADDRFREQYLQLQKQYPLFPRELSAAVLHHLLGNRQPVTLVGDETYLKQKAEIAQKAFVTPQYRSEFFFKYAIKVPYFSDLDWEVVVKTYEKNVKHMPRLAYALLSLVFRDPVDPTLPIEEAASEPSEPEFYTVAVNEQLLDKLIGLLNDAKAALRRAQKVAETLNDQEALEESTDEPNS